MSFRGRKYIKEKKYVIAFDVPLTAMILTAVIPTASALNWESEWIGGQAEEWSHHCDYANSNAVGAGYGGVMLEVEWSERGSHSVAFFAGQKIKQRVAVQEGWIDVMQVVPMTKRRTESDEGTAGNDHRYRFDNSETGFVDTNEYKVTNSFGPTYEPNNLGGTNDGSYVHESIFEYRVKKQVNKWYWFGWDTEEIFDDDFSCYLPIDADNSWEYHHPDARE